MEYREENGVFFPVVELPKGERELWNSLGKYGRMRMEYIKEHQPTIFKTFLTTGRLEEILIQTDEKGYELEEEICMNYRSKHKAKDFLEQVRITEMAKSIAIEIAIKEVVEILL